jgi:2',3'-cyclic-nucleotide 2'-phosphodiesterase/3'-nucleotidase/5'-nucleotidase
MAIGGPHCSMLGRQRAREPAGELPAFARAAPEHAGHEKADTDLMRSLRAIALLRAPAGDAGAFPQPVRARRRAMTSTRPTRAWRRATAALAAASAVSAAAEAQTLQILHASDLEGGVSAIQDAPRFAAVVEGLEADAALAGTPSILLSAGDNYIPGPFFSAAGDLSLRTPLRNALGLPQVREREGRVDVAIMNILGFDAAALGNHEFDPGTPALREIIAPDVRDGNLDGTLDDARWLGVDFPYLSANLDFSGDPSLSGLFEAGIVASTAFAGSQADLAAAAAKKKLARATIVQRGSELFGVVGATTPLLESISSPGLTQVKDPGAGTNDMEALALILQPVVDELLDAGVDKIVLVTHLQQITLEQELVPLLHGVDVAIAGGSDTLLADATDVLRAGDSAAGPYPIVTANADGDPAVVVSTDGQYSYVGRLVVEFDALGRVVPASIDPLESGAYATDDDGVAAVWGDLVTPFLPGTKGARVQSLVDAVQTVVIAKDANVQGNSDVFLEGRRALVRTEETNLGDLSADANLWIAQQTDATVAVSLKNGGGIRDFVGAIDGETGELLPTQANPLSGKLETEVSQLDIENTLRFNNGLTLVTLTAAELVQVLEHGVAASGPGATPGQFPQVGGISFSYDAALPAGSRVRSVAIKDETGATLDVILDDGLLVGDPERQVRMVTLNFLASGGDGYPFPALGEDRVDLLQGFATGAAVFANDGSEQDALAEFLVARHGSSFVAYDEEDTARGRDGRMQDLGARSDTAAQPPVAPAGSIRLEKIGGYDGGLGEGSAEIPAYDPDSQRLFVINAVTATVDVIGIALPASPVLIRTIDVGALFSDASAEASPNSVAVSAGLVAVAVQRRDADGRQLDGLVAFFDADGDLIDQAPAGALPDMVTYTPDGRYALTADEGEPSPDYSFDPEGSITIVDVRRPRAALQFPHLAQRFRLRPGDTKQAHFRAFDGKRDALLAAGVRIYGPGATVAQDVEPEYVTVVPGSSIAVVTLQENNAVAIVDVSKAKVLKIEPLGYKDWSLSALDPSDRDDAIRVAPWSVLGMYQPDAIASIIEGGSVYVVTANEGDARDYETFAEEARVSSLDLDPLAFPDADDLQENAALGRLTVTTALGDLDSDGDFDRLHTLGGRSFSVWQVAANGDVSLVHDSGSDLEEITASYLPARFNGDPFDSRSDNKGPEPEGLVLGEIDGRRYLFLGLERIGGVMVYDVTSPATPQFVQYVNTSDVADGEVVGDVAPEGLAFVPASQSPTGKALVVVAHEVSGTLAIFEAR